MKKILFLLIFITPFILFSQNDEVTNLINQANEKYTSKQYSAAIELLNKAEEIDNKNPNIYYAYGTIYQKLGMYNNMEIKYKQACDEIGPNYPNFYIMLGGIQIEQEKYSKAKESFEAYIVNAKQGSKYINLAKHNIEVCKFAEVAIKNPVPFDPINLGSEVNTKLDEYLPALSVEENELVFTRKVINEKPTFIGDEFQEDFYISRKKGSNWGKSTTLGGNINTNDNEGAQTISSNGKYMFITACNRDDGMGGCDIYFSKNLDGKWSKPVNLGPPLNSEHWDAHPSISPDGKTLYFSSDRPEGKGKTDIWYCNILKGGKFSAAVNMGDKINTENGEVFPFIHTDNKTLYFTSNGHPGMGGYDNFVVKKEGGSWEIPKNLGYPINTNGNESSLIVNAKGKTAYFSSDRKGGFGGIDIYNFSLYEDARPEAITYLKGIIKDSETGEFISANFELYNIETGELIKTSYSNQKNGEFFILIPSDANYLINVEKENYIFYSDNFSVKNESGEKIFEKTIELQKIKTGNKVILKNIFFETNSYKLKDESKLELQKLLSFMKKYPNTKIEIEGHTDNVGEENTNQTLSENRAKSVIQFLVDNGISKERLSANGYGEKMPIADNNTEEGRAINRRTEFKIISAE
jgi:outer membrane protein OmpA-like peptidoglycan-associated protein/tetratricopeptide (TPR) repeat protein